MYTMGNKESYSAAGLVEWYCPYCVTDLSRKKPEVDMRNGCNITPKNKME